MRLLCETRRVRRRRVARDAGKDGGGGPRGSSSHVTTSRQCRGAARVKLPPDDGAAGISRRRAGNAFLVAHAEHGPVWEDDVVDDGRARRGRGRGRAERARKIASLARVVQLLALDVDAASSSSSSSSCVGGMSREGDARRRAIRPPCVPRVWALPARATSDRRFLSGPRARSEPGRGATRATGASVALAPSTVARNDGRGGRRPARGRTEAPRVGSKSDVDQKRSVARRRRRS